MTSGKIGKEISRIPFPVSFDGGKREGEERSMKYSFDLKIGDRVIHVEDEAASAKELWKALAFWDSLPTSGPMEEPDLKFSYRTPGDYEYFALECRSSGKEFKMGERKNAEKSLFPKGWAEIKHGFGEENEEESGKGMTADQERTINGMIKTITERGVKREQIMLRVSEWIGKDWPETSIEAGDVIVQLGEKLRTLPKAQQRRAA